MFKTIFNENYFPPTIIECYKWKSGSYTNFVNSRTPADGKYPNEVLGVWKITHKILNPNYYCEGQVLTKGCY